MFNSINYVCKGNSIKKLIRIKLTHQSCVFYGLNKYTTLFGVTWVFIAVVYMAHLVGSQSERRKFGLDQSESRISPM